MKVYLFIFSFFLSRTVLKTALGHRAEISTELISPVLKRFSLLCSTFGLFASFRNSSGFFVTVLKLVGCRLEPKRVRKSRGR